MPAKRYIPLKYKFMMVLLAIMISSLSIFFYYAFNTFAQDKTLFIMNLNLQVLKAMTHEIKQEIGVRLQNVHNLAPQVFSLAKKGGTDADFFEKSRSNSLSSEALAFTFYRQNQSGDVKIIKTLRNNALLESKKLNDTLFAQLEKNHPLPFEKYESKTKLQLLNRSVTIENKSVPVLTILMSGFSVNKSQKILIAVDLLQDFLLNKLKEANLSEVFLVSKSGSLLSHSSTDEVVKSAKGVYQHPIIERLKSQKSNRESLELDVGGEPYLCNFGETGMGDVYIVSQIRKSQAFLALKELITKSLILAAMIFCAAVAFSIAFAKRLTKNIEKLKLAASKIGEGNLDEKIDIQSNDEIGKVSETFQWMVGKIKELLAATANQVRMEEELKTAQLVQSTILTPPAISSKFVDLVAHYTPATECGGDIWDIRIHNHTATVFIGDATGHGVPAALVTALAKSCFATLGTRYIEQNLTPPQVLDALNEVIYASCKGKLLMTMIIVQLNLETGELIVCNAGHESPLRLRSNQQEDGAKSKTAEVMFTRGERLGFAAGSVFKEESFQLGIGDTVLLYTDGISEATNKSGKQLGERTLRKVFSQQGVRPLAQIKTEIEAKLHSHMDGALQDDDITFVLLAWKQPAPKDQKSSQDPEKPNAEMKPPSLENTPDSEDPRAA